MVVGVSLGYGAAAYGGLGRGRLIGAVKICQPDIGKCSLVAATVTVHRFTAGKKGAAVATEYAPHGRFSFSLAPGTYIPRASAARLKGDDCVSAEVRVRRGKIASGQVLCYRTLPRPAT
jgi:hypothetical protein